MSQSLAKGSWIRTLEVLFCLALNCGAVILKWAASGAYFYELKTPGRAMGLLGGKG